MVKRALLVGINYEGSDAELRGCINDIQNIRSILINNCNYLDVNIRVLTDESSIKPTKSNIESNIRWLVSNARSGDTLIFYYSGHGSYIRDTSGDENDGRDEVIIPVDYEQNGYISDDWLCTNMASRVPNGVKLYGFTDCCHSGTIIDLKYNYKSLCTYKKGQIQENMPYVYSDWTDSFYFNIEKSRNINGFVCLFSGCQDPQVSYDANIDNQYQGAFTYCFIEFLKSNMQQLPDGRKKFRNGVVKLKNVLKEINARLDISGFTGQDNQLSISRSNAIDSTFDL